MQTVGKQWTYVARAIKGHELVTHGPYGVVRNPIYLGMFGLILSTCLAFSRWWTGLAAVVLFLIGNRIRIRSEERLLRETFDNQFEEYARRVPASSRSPGDDPASLIRDSFFAPSSPFRGAGAIDNGSCVTGHDEIDVSA